MYKMINNDRIIQSLIFDAVDYLSTTRGIDIKEAKDVISKMSFIEFHKMMEASTTIVPPSGNTISPNKPSATPDKPATAAPTQVKSIWPGQGAPVEVGMTVGLKDQSGKTVPGEISKVDLSAKGAMVKNPTTGKPEWMNIDNLEPYMDQDNQQPTLEHTSELLRLKTLAGIKENSSAGASCAGAIASVPVAIGKTKKRQQTDEELKKEYTPKHSAKTIVGDTKPNQASGELSATLAANGKKTASRTNNGMKRR